MRERVGVWRGDYAQQIMSILNPTRLYLVDPWTVGEDPDLLADERFSAELSAFSTEANYQGVQKLFAKNISAGSAVLLRKFTNKAVKEFEQANVDFGYIDGCHEYKCVARDLKDYSAKINRQLKSDCTCGFDGIRLRKSSVREIFLKLLFRFCANQFHGRPHSTCGICMICMIQTFNTNYFLLLRKFFVKEGEGLAVVMSCDQAVFVFSKVRFNRARKGKKRTN